MMRKLIPTLCWTMLLPLPVVAQEKPGAPLTVGERWRVTMTMMDVVTRNELMANTLTLTWEERVQAVTADGTAILALVVNAARQHTMGQLAYEAAIGQGNDLELA